MDNKATDLTEEETSGLNLRPGQLKPKKSEKEELLCRRNALRVSKSRVVKRLKSLCQKLQEQDLEPVECLVVLYDMKRKSYKYFGSGPMVKKFERGEPLSDRIPKVSTASRDFSFERRNVATISKDSGRKPRKRLFEDKGESRSLRGGKKRQSLGRSPRSQGGRGRGRGRAKRKETERVSDSESFEMENQGTKIISESSKPVPTFEDLPLSVAVSESPVPNSSEDSPTIPNCDLGRIEMSLYATQQSTMSVLQEDSVKVSQRHVSREERVFASPDPPFSNTQHLLPGERQWSQSDGKLGKIGTNLQDAEQLQSKDFLNTTNTYMYSIKKSGTSCIVSAKTQDSKKTMIPRRSQDFLSLQETDLMEKPGKPEKQDKTQEGQPSEDEVFEIGLQLREEYGTKSNFSSNLDLRMPLPSSTQSHVTFNQIQDLAPKVHPTEIQTMKDFETIKDNSYQDKPLLDFIEIEGQMVCESGTANAEKETIGTLPKDTKLMKNQMRYGIGTAASEAVTCDNLPRNTELPNLMGCDARTADSVEAMQQELLKDPKSIKNQMACSTETVSGAMTCGNLPTDTDLLNFLQFDTETDASQPVDDLLTYVDLQNFMGSDSGTANAKKETNGDLPTDIGVVENVNHFTGRAASKAVACGDLLTGIKPREDQIRYDTGTLNANSGISHGTEEDLDEFAQNHNQDPIGFI